jgi:hypothetical protein
MIAYRLEAQIIAAGIDLNTSERGGVSVSSRDIPNPSGDPDAF